MSDKEPASQALIDAIAAIVAEKRQHPDVVHVKKNIVTVVGSLSEEYQHNPDVTLSLIRKAIARYRTEYGVDLGPLFTNPELRVALDKAE